MRDINDVQKGFQCCSSEGYACGKCPYSEEDLDLYKCFRKLREDVTKMLSAFGYLEALSRAAIETVEALMGASPGQYCSMCSKAYTPECDKNKGGASCTPKWKENRSLV